MATKYIVVSIQWAPGTFPNKQLGGILRQKAKEYVDAGLSVSGLLVLDPSEPGQDKLSLTQKVQTNEVYSGETHTMDFIKYGPIANNVTHVYDPVTDTYNSTFPPGEIQRNIRLFTTEQAANEFIDFALTLGAESAMIVAPEEYASILTLPPDSVIDQYVTTV